MNLRSSDSPNTAVFTAPLQELELRDSGSGPGAMTIRGHAAVFNRLSHDLGGFKERIDPAAFDAVLDTNPDVHLVWDHDTSLTLARTKNKTLELRRDPMGLHMWARVAPTSYAADLKVLMDRGDVDQASFKFTIEREEWTEDESGNITATILEVRDLYDVTVTAMGAYPQTDASLAHKRFERAVSDGRVPGRATLPIAAAQTPGEEADPTAASPGGSASPTGADSRAKRQRELDMARANTP